ncbi:hypothetical protein QO058_14670 [Bosea vestrisii]|uniref:DUF6894 family protein n=1 Tax=Bosea vestrisii TaxID=151416 RepID=UPI0024DF5A26|nr:hypothetical protein [Bosea vestrisii]WID99359.1 hypothetical protein QO058_14670 [Bosea vestrisii]
MPKYTITTNDSESVERSEEPLEFPHTKAATDDAQVALGEMAREKLPNGKRADFGVSVEDETGKEVYRADLNFSAKTEDDLDRESEEADADDVAVTSGPVPAPD